MTHPIAAQLRKLVELGKCHGAIGSADAVEVLLTAAQALDRLRDDLYETTEDMCRLENEQLKKELLNMSLKLAEYEPVLRLIANGPRADGTYNYCREACQKLAQKALGHDE